jgi:type II secretory pathway pseudopilin PulG
MPISPRSCRGVCVKRLTNKPGAWHKRRSNAAFTILELLTVIAIIITLAGLILGTTGYIQKKAARSRAETEIAAMSAACESYKADNGTYPTDPGKTESLDPTAAINFTNYKTATLYLYEMLSGDTNANLQPVNKSYFTFKPQMLDGTKNSNGSLTSVTNIRDPFGNSYGYSTMKAANSANNGYNPTFDLWSTAGVTASSNPPDQSQWLKNW